MEERKQKMEDYRFKVNLGGMIEILSDHLYSSPDVYIRELLQNGVDAITARKQVDAAFEGQITLEIKEGQGLVFTDNGQGLTEEEIHKFLAIIGESSKRDVETGKIHTDYIGRFGIGLLSCFMVSDEIRMITKSCKEEDAQVLEWCGKPDGTYTIQRTDACMKEPGTKVILTAKRGMEVYFTRGKIEELITYYGILLPFPVIVMQDGEQKQINPIYLPWDGRKTNKQELLFFGKLMFGEEFFDCVMFHSEAGNVSGAAFIRNYPVLPSAKSNHRIYLKNMLLTEKGENLIPDWAVFTRCIINATDLRPTASREGFYEDEVLKAAKEAIENQMIEYIVTLAKEQPGRFEQFFRLHNLTLMSLALANEKLFRTLIDYFEFETTRGIMTGYELRMSDEPLIYAPTREKYKQLSQLFFAQDKLLINVSYVHSLDLLHGLGELFDLEVSQVEDYDIEALMKDVSVDDQDVGFDFLARANRILKSCDCKAELKYFSPETQPTFYLLDENTLIQRQIQASMENGASIFQNMLNTFAQENQTAATLYFNFHNPMVRKLVEVEKEADLKIFVEILYVQALQIGGFTLHKNEAAMLNRNIMALIEKGLSV